MTKEEYKEVLIEERRKSACEAIDEFYYIVLRNPMVINALTRANDKNEILDILHKQYDKMKMSID